MTNPIDNDTLRVYLKFKSLGITELYEIETPSYFEGAVYEKKQEEQRHARSVEYLAFDKVRFELCEGRKLNAPRVINSRGEQSEFMDMGLDYIFETKNKFGANSEIELHISQNGVFFPYLELDFTDADLTDEETFFECKLIQSGKVSEIKRQYDNKFNVFATKNYKDEDITPAPTVRMLRKGTAQRKQSKYKSSSDYVSRNFVQGLGTREGTFYFNPCDKIEKSEIKNTLIGLFDLSPNSSNSKEDFRFVRAKTELTNVAVKISNLNWRQVCLNFGGAGNGYATSKFIVSYGFSADNPISFFDPIQNIIYDGDPEIVTTLNQTFTIPYLPAGAYIYIYFENYIRKSNALLGGIECINFIDIFNVDIDAVTKPLSVVIPTVRYIDLIRQSLKNVNGLPVQSSLYDVGGQEYNNVVYNKRMISGKTDLFYATPKQVFEQLVETNSDVELNNEYAFIGQEREFYQNVEIGYFKEAISERYTTEFNKKHAINKIKLEYKEYAQDKALENSNTSIHGRSEWNVVNPKSENFKEISIPFIRDYNKKQEIVDQLFFKPETATTEDSSIAIDKIVELPPNHYEEWSALLSFRISNGKLEVLNRDTNGEASDFIVNWNLIPIQVGQQFQIVFGANSGTYTIDAITTNVLTLSGGNPNYQGDAGVMVRYYAIGVEYTNQTSEGFIGLGTIESTFSDLEVSPKRILNNYYSNYLASCMMYSPVDKIANVEYYPNKDFVSQKTTEANPIVESEAILKSNLPVPLITQNVDNFYLGADYGEVIEMMELYKTQKGFITVNRNDKLMKGFIKDFKYNPTTQELDVVLERKYENNQLVLKKANDELLVNDALYQLDGVMNWWEFRNNEFRVFDKKMRPISNFYNFNLVNLNGVNYTSKQLLIEALEEL
jgi:hypothetical protein